MTTQSLKCTEFNDYELLYMIRQQDEMAFQYLFKKYESHLKMLIAKKWNCSFSLFDENDLLQLAYLKVLEAIEAYNETRECSFCTYMTMCVLRKLTSQRRTELRHRIVSYSLQKEVHEASETLYEEKVENNQSLYNPSYYIEYKLVLAQMKKFVDSLSEADKKILNCMTEGLSYKDAAARLEMTPKGYDNAVYRIKKKLNQYLKQTQFD